MSRTLVLLALCLAWAQAPAAESRANPPNGQQTRQWLDLQASNNASLATPRPMPGEVAEAVYKRYVDSFRQPIPDAFERETFKSTSGGQ